MADQRPRSGGCTGRAVGWGLLGCAGLVAMFILAFVVGLNRSSAGATKSAAADPGAARLGVVKVEGMIMSGGLTGGLLGGGATGAESIVRDLRKAAANDQLAGIILRINSPGGTAAASQEIYEAVREAATKKPVVASMADVAASGGYYVAAGATHIMANPATMTGSIGVIMSNFNFSGLMDRYGVTDTTVTSGAFKDAGSPTRPMRPEERDLFQALIDDTYRQFLADVAKGRDVPTAQVRPFADGRVLTGSQALAAGLIDELGGLRDAARRCAQLAGKSVPPEPRLESMTEPSLLDTLLGTPTTRAGFDPRLLVGGGPPLWLVSPGALPGGGSLPLLMSGQP